MFKRNNMRVLLVLSVALFVLCSSVDMVPARSFLNDIKRYSKRQGNEPKICESKVAVIRIEILLIKKKEQIENYAKFNSC